MVRFLVFWTLAVSFGGQSFALTSAEKDQICPAMGQLAEEIMKRRQEGLAMSALIAALKNDDPAADKIIRSLITDAYGRPKFSTDKVINQTVAEFRNSVEYECYK
jgi:hypothetical protein